MKCIQIQILNKENYLTKLDVFYDEKLHIINLHLFRML